MLRLSTFQERKERILDSYNADHGTAFKTLAEAEDSESGVQFCAYRVGFYAGMIAQIDLQIDALAPRTTNDPAQNAIINAELLPDGP